MQVSIITINYNSSIFTIKLVESIFENVSKLIDYEIIITDNASKDSDYKNLVKALPRDGKIKLYRNKVNNGFSGGIWMAMKNQTVNIYYLSIMTVNV